MSTLQVANIHFESTQNNRVQYFGSNNFAFVAAGANVMTLNTSAVSFSGGLSINSMGVGTPASGVTGEIRATNNIIAYYSSDERLKNEITVIPNALDKVKSIRGVSFDWNDEYIRNNGGEDGYFIRKHDVGVIAQEIEKVLPEAVVDRSDGTKAVKYEKIIALLIEAIKELSEKVES